MFDELDERGWDLWAMHHSPHAHRGLPLGDRPQRLAFYPALPVSRSPTRRTTRIDAACVFDRRRRGRGGGADGHVTAPRFTEDQVQRYARHIILPNVGAEGQRKLLDASVLVMGPGGLGSPTASYLAAAGVGQLGIVDFDAVDVSNLQRQILHGSDDVGRPKVASAVEHLRAINPTIEVVSHERLLFSTNVFETFGGYDVIVDGTDNFRCATS